MNKKQITIVPFRIEHLELMDIRKHELENIFCIKGYKEKLEFLSSIGSTITIIYDNNILGVLGLYDLYKGVGEAWIIPCKTIPKHGYVFAKIIKTYFKSVWNINYYHRLQATALNDKIHNRFFSWLGFELETPNVMKNFTINKCNYNMWSRTK